MKSLMLLSSFVFLLSCSNVQNNDEKLKQENIALVEKYIDAIQKKDIQTMSDMLSDNYMGYGPSFTDSINKVDAVENFKNVAENLYDKIVYTASINIAASVTDEDIKHPGNFVSNWAHLTITYKDGRGPVNLYTNTAYRIENGKITMTRTIYDEADAERQLETTSSNAGQ